jgi:hypothetical protein
VVDKGSCSSIPRVSEGIFLGCSLQDVRIKANATQRLTILDDLDLIMIGSRQDISIARV